MVPPDKAERIFAEDIAPDRITGVAQQHPSVVIVAGQPGASKPFNLAQLGLVRAEGVAGDSTMSGSPNAVPSPWVGPKLPHTRIGRWLVGPEFADERVPKSRTKPLVSQSRARVIRRRTPTVTAMLNWRAMTAANQHIRSSGRYVLKIGPPDLSARRVACRRCWAGVDNDPVARHEQLMNVDGGAGQTGLGDCPLDVASLYVGADAVDHDVQRDELSYRL